MEHNLKHLHHVFEFYVKSDGFLNSDFFTPHDKIYEVIKKISEYLFQ